LGEFWKVLFIYIYWNPIWKHICNVIIFLCTYVLRCKSANASGKNLTTQSKWKINYFENIYIDLAANEEAINQVLRKDESFCK
jgi:hypothetical protein